MTHDIDRLWHPCAERDDHTLSNIPGELKMTKSQTTKQRRDNLTSLAEAVLALASGMGGDEQEQSRAREIASALIGLAGGVPIGTVQSHEAARDRYFRDPARYEEAMDRFHCWTGFHEWHQPRVEAEADALLQPIAARWPALAFEVRRRVQDGSLQSEID
jgi:hypothetical protein